VKIDLDINGAGQILDALGSDQDPVYYRGIETTVNELAYGEHGDKDARRFVIEFYGGRSRGLRKIKGTVFAMILDRLGVMKRRQKRASADVLGQKVGQ